MLIVLIYSSLEIILQQHNNFHWITMLLTIAIYGLGYSDVSKQVFVSKYLENQIRVLDNDGFFNKTLYVIGNAFNNNTLVSPPNASSLNTPWKIQQDCAGGFWVVDRGNCRVLHFKWNQTVADAVIGQPNFTTDCSSNLGIFSQSNHHLELQ